MEKRVLLAVSLSFLVLVAYQTFFVKPVPRPATAPASSSVASPANTSNPGSSATTADSSGGTAVEAVPAAPAAEGVTFDTVEREIVVESDSIRAVFTNRGGELKSWQLKKYFDSSGKPIDIIPAGIPDTEARAFALISEDSALTSRMASALYQVNTTAIDLRSDSRELVFEYEDASGLKVSKRLSFAPNGHPYLVSVDASVTEGDTAVPVALSLGPGIGDTTRVSTSKSFFSPSYYQAPEALVQKARKVTRIPAASLATQAVHEDAFTTVGVDDQYFIAMVLAGDRSLRATYETVHLMTPAGPRDLVRLRTRVDGGLDDVRVFLGPKQYDVLAGINRELVRVINFGIFDWLVVPLLQALTWIDRFVGNYGWSIILLTLLINAVIAPLRHRSVVSMRKMQEIQPQVKAIQERYAGLKATDPAKQKMNTEMMNLYREKGVNPASGCVPLVLTMPVLFAFYAMLSQAIELRGAPFIGWIHDLSVHDPYYVTPLLMGASMVLQQKMTPSTADPVQQRVMMFMPALFTFMFLFAPAGLVLYWLVSNMWAIGQQMVTNRIIGPPKIAAARPPAEKRMKQAGTGRTQQAN